MDRLEESCRFTSRLLEHGNGTEVLSLRKVVGTRLQELISNKPPENLAVNLEFHTDFNKFQTAIKVSFHNLINKLEL